RELHRRRRPGPGGLPAGDLRPARPGQGPLRPGERLPPQPERHAVRGMIRVLAARSRICGRGAKTAGLAAAGWATGPEDERMSDDLLADVAARVRAYQDGLADRPVNASAGAAELQAMLGGELPSGPTDPCAAVAALAEAVDAGSVATTGPRYFGFVVCGA